MLPASLFTKSHFSFLEGASAPEDLVARAIDQGCATLALTDRDGVYGAPSAWQASKDTSLRLIVGSQVTVQPDESSPASSIVLLAATRQGWRNLCRLLTSGRLRCEKGRCWVTWQEVAAHAPGLIALWGGRESLLTQEAPGDLASTATLLREAFDDGIYALAPRHLTADEQRMEARLRRRAKRWELPVVATVEVLYHTRRRRRLQDVLTCIREGTTLADAGTLLRPNDRHVLPSPKVFAKLFADDPAALARTEEVAVRCTFSLDQLRYRYPAEHLPYGMSEARWLDHLVKVGAKDRFGAKVPGDLQSRIDRELVLIHDLDYEGYFLTMYEIVRFCRQEGIVCQGRGSAANSVVCYCLKISAVNPREVDLLFERFISRERAEPPDIDLDIEHGRREEVIQHVYAKYGRKRAAMVCNTVRFRPRSAIREVGKALGLPAVNLDRLAKLTSYRGELDATDLKAAGFDPRAPLHRHFAEMVDTIQEFPRHLSIHPGGFLLGHEPVHDLVPIENASMAGRTVIQWNKYDVEALGLFKVDLLGLGALNQLHKAFDLLREHRDVDLSLARIPRDDPATFAMLHKADTVGVFQVESRAQMNMLPRLRPESYYDLVIQVAIIRPGPITGGMLHPYLARRHGQEEVTYPHPNLEPVLKKTLGVPLFQEQVMRLAMVAADYSPGEADQLRRDMATWRSHGPIEEHHGRLVERMVAKGIELEFAERVFQQIKGFGEYGFPESHAASFALIAYATAWLKCHHHAVFTCALLNAQPMGFYSSGTIVEDAKRHDIVVLPIDVTVSDWDCTLEGAVGSEFRGSALGFASLGAERRVAPELTADHSLAPQIRSPGSTSKGKARLCVRMGLRYVKGLRKEHGEVIAREQRLSPYRSIEDLKRRTRAPADALVALAEAGALSVFAPERRQALWIVHGLSKRDRPEQLILSLDDPAPAPALPGLTDLDEVNWDWRRSGHSTRAHLLEPLRATLRAKGWPTAAEVSALKHGRRTDYVGVVICRQRPHTASGVTFMTLEDETGFVNLVMWNQVWQEHKVLAKTLSLMGVSGKIQSEERVVHLIVDKVWEPRLQDEPIIQRSRDFH
ncbi:MAG: DNA polymerase III subunit alpha [bacterium]|nr:DNA polymerase III subunit alpha [bacterium]